MTMTWPTACACGVGGGPAAITFMLCANILDELA